MSFPAYLEIDSEVLSWLKAVPTKPPPTPGSAAAILPGNPRRPI